MEEVAVVTVLVSALIAMLVSVTVTGHIYRITDEYVSDMVETCKKYMKEIIEDIENNR